MKIPFRLWIGVMVFFSTFTNYMLRVNLAVSIVAMALPKNKTVSVPTCLKGTNYTKTVNQTVLARRRSNSFDWSESQVALLLGAYFYGYETSILFSGTLAELLGPWHMIFWTSVVSTLLVALAPLSAKGGGFGGLFANRFLAGVFGGPLYPAISVIIARWAPPKEKGKFLSAMLGNTIGSLVTFVLVGVVTHKHGWEWGFYVLAIIMIFYCVAVFFIIADSPEKSRWVSQEEKDFIAESQMGNLSKKKAAAPFVKILINLRVWSMIIAQYGNLWALNLVSSYGPKFMKEQLGFDIKSSAGLAAIPYLARMICSAIFGSIGDWMRKKEVMTVTNIRKFFIIFSHFIPAVLFALIYPAGCNAPFVVSLIVLNQGFNGAIVVGHFANPQDLTPNFAGTLYSLMNFIGMTTGFIVPAITGAVNDAYHKDLMAAVVIYAIGACVLLFTGIFFVLFGSGDVQKFNEVTQQPNEQTEQK